MVIDPDGTVIVDYNKVHLVTGLETQFTAGQEPGLFKISNAQVGTAICKDMDFPGYIDDYGINGAGALFVPAWDFTVDDWLHSRMSIIRGIENGFSEVRAARLGRLTISDAYGRITAEANCASGNPVSLTGNVSLDKTKTIYLLMGDWLGIVCIVAAGMFIFINMRRNRLPDGKNKGLAVNL